MPSRTARLDIGLAAAGILITMSACGAEPSATPGGTATATHSVASSSPAPGSAQFNLFLIEPAAHTASFGLYLQTDPASIGQDQLEFCGSGTLAPRPCEPGRQPLTIRVGDFPAGTVLVYRFERIDDDGTIEVLSEGRAVLDRALVREATYPEPAATQAVSATTEIRFLPGLVGLA